MRTRKNGSQMRKHKKKHIQYIEKIRENDFALLKQLIYWKFCVNKQDKKSANPMEINICGENENQNSIACNRDYYQFVWLLIINSYNMF